MPFRLTPWILLGFVASCSSGMSGKEGAVLNEMKDGKVFAEPSSDSIEEAEARSSAVVIGRVLDVYVPVSVGDVLLCPYASNCSAGEASSIVYATRVSVEQVLRGRLAAEEIYVVSSAGLINNSPVEVVPLSASVSHAMSEAVCWPNPSPGERWQFYLTRDGDLPDDLFLSIYSTPLDANGKPTSASAEQTCVIE